VREELRETPRQALRCGTGIAVVIVMHQKNGSSGGKGDRIFSSLHNFPVYYLTGPAMLTRRRRVSVGKRTPFIIWGESFHLPPLPVVEEVPWIEGCDASVLPTDNAGTRNEIPNPMIDKRNSSTLTKTIKTVLKIRAITESFASSLSASVGTPFDISRKENANRLFVRNL
jgi:hypothetical protein